MLVLLIKIVNLDCFYLLISYSWEILNLNLKFAVCCKRGSKSLFRFSRLLRKVFFFFSCGYDGFPPKPEKQNSQIPIKSWTYERFDIWILGRECYGVL